MNTAESFKEDSKLNPLTNPLLNRAWKHAGTNFFEFKGEMYLVEVHFFKLAYLPNTTLVTVNCKLKDIFAHLGIPLNLTSDRGPQYTSAEFRIFMSDYGILHVFLSP